MAAYLGLSIITVATISLLIQTAAYFVLITGFIFARKKIFSKHRIIMITATSLNLISLLIVMLPSFLSILPAFSFSGTISITNLVVLHHTIGLVTLLLAAVLIFRECKSTDKNKRIFMRTVFTLWTITYFLGVYVFLTLYTIY